MKQKITDKQLYNIRHSEHYKNMTPKEIGVEFDCKERHIKCMLRGSIRPDPNYMGVRERYDDRFVPRTFGGKFSCPQCGCTCHSTVPGLDNYGTNFPTQREANNCCSELRD